MIKMKKLTEETQATPVKDIELCGKQDCLGQNYKEEKAKHDEEVNKLLKIKKDDEKNIIPTQEPITESINVKDRTELVKVLESMKSEGKKCRICRSKVEGYRYTVTPIIESKKLVEEELPDAKPEEPIVVSTEDEVGKDELVKESTRFSLISNLITDLWNAINNYKGTLTTIQLDELNTDVELEEILNNMVDESLVNIGLLNKLIGIEEQSKTEESLREVKEEEKKSEYGKFSWFIILNTDMTKEQFDKAKEYDLEAKAIRHDLSKNNYALEGTAEDMAKFCNEVVKGKMTGITAKDIDEASRGIMTTVCKIK